MCLLANGKRYPSFLGPLGMTRDPTARPCLPIGVLGCGPRVIDAVRRAPSSRLGACASRGIRSGNRRSPRVTGGQVPSLGAVLQVARHRVAPRSDSLPGAAGRAACHRPPRRPHGTRRRTSPLTGLPARRALPRPTSRTTLSNSARSRQDRPVLHTNHLRSATRRAKMGRSTASADKRRSGRLSRGTRPVAGPAQKGRASDDQL